MVKVINHRCTQRRFNIIQQHAYHYTTFGTAFPFWILLIIPTFFLLLNTDRLIFYLTFKFYTKHHNPWRLYYLGEIEFDALNCLIRYILSILIVQLCRYSL